jgi:hypothetical protein
LGKAPCAKKIGFQKHDGQRKMIVAKLGVVVGDCSMNSMSQHERQYASKHGIAYVLDQMEVGLHVK